MSNIIDVLKSIGDDLMTLDGVSEDEIKRAEEQLEILFSEEYKQYLRVFGIASWDSRELTGLCKSKHQNVVDVTLRCRRGNEESRSVLYVIEELGIDWIVIWQNADGEIFQTVGNENPVKLFETLADYIKQANLMEKNKDEIN